MHVYVALLRMRSDYNKVVRYAPTAFVTVTGANGIRAPLSMLQDCTYCSHCMRTNADVFCGSSSNLTNIQKSVSK